MKSIFILTSKHFILCLKHISGNRAHLLLLLLLPGALQAQLALGQTWQAIKKSTCSHSTCSKNY